MKPEDYRVYFPIHYSAQKENSGIIDAVQNYEGMKSIVRMLEAGENPNKRDNAGNIALYLAIKHFNYEKALCLLRHPKTNPYFKDKKGNTVLDIVIRIMLSSSFFVKAAAILQMRHFLSLSKILSAS